MRGGGCAVRGANWQACGIGQAVFIVLDNVSFPCTARTRARPRERPFCKQYWKTYAGRLPPDQMTFIENVLKATGPRLVVFAAHLPFVGFDNSEVQQPHQTANLDEASTPW
ncbi:hypothetical protein ACRAWD_21425 [Caulobacter segnis]